MKIVNVFNENGKTIQEILESYLERYFLELEKKQIKN